MSDHPHLPPEIFDHIIDFLHNDPDALKQCCLVSKSWVPRTRKYLFAHIRFQSRDSLKLWRKAFPDPTNSPAHHAHTLTLGRALIDARDGRWIRGFSHVERLGLVLPGPTHSTIHIPFATLLRLSSTLKCLFVTFNVPHPHMFNLIRSLPLLEDLTLSGHDIILTNTGFGAIQAPTPSASPPLTGCLELYLFEGETLETTRQLLALPGGLHPRKLRLWCGGDDPIWVGQLVAACSDTVEHLEIACETNRTIDLSKATKLKDVTLRWGSMKSWWVVKTLETITSEHRDLRNILIQVPCAPGFDNVGGHRIFIQRTEEMNSGMRWSNLDSLLVQLWESRSVRSKVVCSQAKDGAEDWLGCLFPEMTKRGFIGLVG